MLESRTVEGVNVTVLPGKFRAEDCLPGDTENTGYFRKLHWGENPLGDRVWFFSPAEAYDHIKSHTRLIADYGLGIADIGDSGIYILIDAGDLGG